MAKILILTATLSGCVTKNSNACLSNLDLPVMPLAGERVVNELELVCTEVECYNLNSWFNELAIFREEYEVVKSVKKF